MGLPGGRLEAQTGCGEGPVALVLSGGGAKGLAHLGVLRVLEERGIRPDLIVGTSIGAIVGGMYASGYSAATLDSLARALPLASYFRTYEPERRDAWEDRLPLVLWEGGSRGLALQTAAVREAQVNALFNAALLRGDLLARGHFDRLPIPFLAVATDLRTREPVVLDSGDLARAVRASAAIPLVFAPEEIDGRPLVDGGLSANIPIAIARRAGAHRVIVSDVTERMHDSVNTQAPVAVAEQLLTFLFQQPVPAPAPGDLWIRPAVDSFRSLDFAAGKIDSLIALGRAAATRATADWSCGARGSLGPEPVRDTALAAFAIGTIDLPDRADRARLEAALGHRSGEILDLAAFRRGLLRVGEVDAWRAVWLTPAGGGDTVSFAPVIRRAPRHVVGLGVAFDNELSGRLWLGWNGRLHPTRTRDAASAVIALGRFRRDADLGFRHAFGNAVRRPTAVVQVRGSTEDVRAFDPDGEELPSRDTKEVAGMTGLELPLVWGARLTAGAEARLWRTPEGDVVRSAGAAVRLRWDERLGRRPIVSGEFVWGGNLRMVTGAVTPRMETGRWIVEPVVRLGWGAELPVQATFPLGGDEGFPGLHIGERRGDREVYGALRIRYLAAGPVGIEVTGAAGRTAIGGTLLGRDGWLGGVRAGLGADSPIGPVAFAYGVASNGRGTTYVRIGRWF